MEVYTYGMKSPIGPLTIKANDKGILSIEFKQTKKRELTPLIKKLRVELEDYFAGKIKKFKTPLILDGTEFQKKCWKELQKISYGKTISYKEEALKLGGSNYARAVAGANNRNPLPIIIPCHRVIGSDGSLVGYAGGLKVKKQLLDLEKSFR